MRTAAFAIALLMSGAAIAQTYEPDVDVDADVGVQPDGELDVDADVDVDPDMDVDADMVDPAMDVDVDPAMDVDVAPDVTPADVAAATDPTVVAAADVTPVTTPVVQPGNADPEHDARGIAVISAPAVVPPGWNGLVVTAVGGPLVDPTTGETIDADDASYPPCTASVTDNCVQTYERGVPG